MSVLKTVLFRLGLLPLISQARNGTWKYLGGGYDPKKFWGGWGARFHEKKIQREIHGGQRWLLEKIRSSKCTRALEIGCGFGRNLDYLTRNLEGRPVFWGLDISEKMLLKGRRELSAACGLAQGDLQALPFRGERFNLVFTHGVLMHVPPHALAGALAEMARVCGSEILLVEETFWKGIKKRESVNLNGYTFIHDYAGILPREGFDILESGESGGPVNMILLRCRKK
ncbi:MAG: class I SAM-dependent methyltransferase [Fibrobacterota bacterium]|nr:class I SAM-dependent methyltransferase [Fibrobacterota bacterium]